ncbi:MAG: hypothetical protein LBF85_04195, partial [Tannerella sp.]|nr:hypothetical protein [Tannerella sp.]
SARWIASYLAMTPDAVACNNGIYVIATARYEAGSNPDMSLAGTKQSGIMLHFINFPFPNDREHF